MRKLILAITRPSAVGADVGFLALRLWVGIAMAFAHGLGKFGNEGFAAGVAEMGLPAPELMAVLAALAEFVGGLLIAVGLMTRPAALALLITMGVAAFIRHADDPFGTQEKPILYGITYLLLLCTGPGRLSVDHLLYRKYRRR